jgi:hypothetical protein
MNRPENKERESLFQDLLAVAYTATDNIENEEWAAHLRAEVERIEAEAKGV